MRTTPLSPYAASRVACFALATWVVGCAPAADDPRRDARPSTRTAPPTRRTRTRSSAAKVDYARAEGLGGVIIWDLAGGYRASQPAGSRDVLLRAVGRAAFGR